MSRNGLVIYLNKDKELKRAVDKAVYLGFTAEQKAPLAARIRATWLLQKRTAADLADTNKSVSSRMGCCRPWGRWVSYNGMPLPKTCDYSICPHCQARLIERLYYSLANTAYSGYTFVYTTVELNNDPRALIKSVRDSLSYRLGKLYKLSGLTFVRLISGDNRWKIGVSAIIPNKLEQEVKLVDSKFNAEPCKSIYNLDNRHAAAVFLSAALRYPRLLIGASSTNIINYFNISYKLHSYRTFGGFAILNEF